MSNQGEDGWYPECSVCQCGNLKGVVCLDCYVQVKKQAQQEIANKVRLMDISLVECSECSEAGCDDVWWVASGDWWVIQNEKTNL